MPLPRQSWLTIYMKENDMATVRFSKDLQDAIVKNAERMFDKQMDMYKQDRDAGMPRGPARQ